MARRICETLLREGIRAGAQRAYLQVLAENAPAIDLYQSLSFACEYTYWFRVKSTLE